MRSTSSGRWWALNIIMAVAVGQITLVVSLTQFSKVQVGQCRSTTASVPALQHTTTTTMPFCPRQPGHRYDTKLNAADPIAKTSDSASSSSSSSSSGKKKSAKQQIPQQQTSPAVPRSIVPDVKQSDDVSVVSDIQRSGGDDDATAASKFRSLKDYMWIRDTLEDLAAAEFACSVEATTEDPSTALPRRRRAVDYEKLIAKLNGRIEDMMGGRRYMQEINTDVDISDGEAALILPVGKGMGRVVYARTQREELLSRVLMTRGMLLEVMRGKNQIREAKNNEEGRGELPFGIQLPEIPELPTLGIPKEEEAANAPGPKLYVRDDGTLDWDGALQDRAALRKFGSAVWARINGQNPTVLGEEEEDEEKEKGGKKASSKSLEHAPPERVTARIEDTAEILEARERLALMEATFKDMQASHTALLTSGIRTGQAVANVNLASLKPSLRNKIRESAEALESMEQRVSFQTLIYELERIYTYLATELGNPAATGYVPLQDRLNVAEFGLLESQIENFHREIDARDVIDEDVLAVVMEQLTDFKRRLGIDYFVAGFTFDQEAIRQWLANLLEQTKSGLAFYVKGCQLFWNDLVFCASLILRAAQGYTLKPREVRNIRRTFKDIVTFIPVVIILIIPLSPVGHVLVFGAIQRFFPDFFPSCFTEQRQNLLQLYETAEFSEVQIKETLREKIARIIEAVWFFILSKSASAIHQLSGKVENDSDVNGSSRPQ